MRISIENFKSKKPGRVCTLRGQIIGKRELGKISFVRLADFSGELQLVIERANLIQIVAGIEVGSCIEVSGQFVATGSGCEMLVQGLEIIVSIEEAPVVQYLKEKMPESLEVQLDNRAISLRNIRNKAIFKVQGEIVQFYRSFMRSEGFTEYFPPAMLASSSEGGTEIFKLPYFGGEATLAQSSQLYKQIMVGAYHRVFALAKWFRAENSHTRRHLTEGHQLEFELGFIDGKEDVMRFLERFVLALVERLRTTCAGEMKVIGCEPIVCDNEIPRLTFAEACDLLESEYGMDTSEWLDLPTEAERNLCEYVRTEMSSDFVFVTNFKKGPFYCFRNESGELENFDLLCRSAEICSGGQRIHNYEELRGGIIEAGLELEGFSEYLSTFKAGMPPHGGFGLGLERLTMLLLGLENIREASLFPSDTKRVASQKLIV